MVKIKNIGYNRYITTELKKSLDGDGDVGDDGSEEEGSDVEEDIPYENMDPGAGFLDGTETNKTGTRTDMNVEGSMLDIHDLVDKEEVESPQLRDDLESPMPR